MKVRSSVSTFLPVTAITLLVWLWAAGETRESDELVLNMSYSVPRSSDWHVDPARQSVTVSIEGSKVAIQQALGLQGNTINIELPAEEGEHRIDLMRELNEQEDIVKAGVNVTDAESPVVYVDPIDTIVVQVEPDLQGVLVDADMEIEPQQISVRLPRRLTPDNQFKAVAQPELFELKQLKPGETKVLKARLSLSARSLRTDAVQIEPETVQITFRVRTLERQTTLPTVRVHLAGPPEDHELYRVEIDPAFRTLQDVTITASAELIERIRRNEFKVWAYVVLSSSEKEAATLGGGPGTITKPVASFMVVDGDGTDWHKVPATIKGSTDLPLIKMVVSRRNAEPE